MGLFMIDKLTADKIRKFYSIDNRTFDYSSLSSEDKQIVLELRDQKFINVLTVNDFGAYWEIESFELLPNARVQLEEYDRANKQLENDAESIRVAKQANKKSDVSNWIAGCAFAAAVAAIVVEIIFHCV